jgi:acyl-CoA thioesterase-1
LTAGRGLARDEALPSLIQQRVDEAGLSYRVINAGRSGDTTAGGLARLGWYLESAGEIGAVVIALGSNDAMRGLPLASVEANLRSIAQRTRAAAPSAKIFIWALETFPNLGADYRAQYAAIFPRVAAEETIALIPFPLRAVAGRPELNQEDGIHPTAEGTRLVADSVWASLRSHL